MKKLLSPITIDRYVRNESANLTLSMMGSPIPIECKNWNEPADVNTIRIFAEKVREMRSTTGILFSRKGITGDRYRDAWGKVLQAFQSDGIQVVVISKQDIEDVSNGADFTELLVKKVEDIRLQRAPVRKQRVKRRK